VLAGQLDCRSRWATRGSPSSGEQPARLGSLASRRKPARKNVSDAGLRAIARTHQWRPSVRRNFRKLSNRRTSTSRALCTPEPWRRGTCESKARAKRSRGRTHRRKALLTLGSGSGGALLAERGLRGNGSSLTQNPGPSRHAGGTARATGRSSDRPTCSVHIRRRNKKASVEGCDGLVFRPNRPARAMTEPP
jgi:hypothetical protein